MSQRKCSACTQPATYYAMDTCPGGWGDYYCVMHIPARWIAEPLMKVAK